MNRATVVYIFMVFLSVVGLWGILPRRGPAPGRPFGRLGDQPGGDGGGNFKILPATLLAVGRWPPSAGP